PVTAATLSDVLPANTTFGSFTGPAGWTIDTSTAATTGIVTATNTSTPLASGATAVFTLTVTVNAGAAGAVTNTAAIAAPTGTVDVNAANNLAIDTDTIAPITSESSVDLGIDKTDNTATATPGSTVTYVITVTNAGPSTATNATVNDIFPATLTNVTFTATGTPGTVGFTPNGSGNITDTVTIPATGSITYTVTGTVSPSATGALANSATVTASAANIE